MIYNEGKNERGISTYSPALLPDPGSNPGRLAATYASRPLYNDNAVSRTYKFHEAKSIFVYKLN